MITLNNKTSALFITALALSGCNSNDDSNVTGAVTPPTTSTSVVFNPEVKTDIPADMSIAEDAGFERYTELLIDVPAATNNGAVALSSATPLKIRIIGTDDSANNEKIIRAGNIMRHLLENVEGGNYGADKSSIIRSLGERQATLILTKDQEENDQLTVMLYAATALELNVLDRLVLESGVTGIRTDSLAHFVEDFSNLPEPAEGSDVEADSEKVIESLLSLHSNPATPKWLINSQSLQYRELSVEGDCHYMSDFAQEYKQVPNEDSGELEPVLMSKYCNDLGENSDRDAAFEEILHLVQAQGIAPNAETSAYQEAVRAHAQTTYERTDANKPWAPTADDLEEWAGDDTNPEIGPTYSHEYLAAVFEAFMGMNGHKTLGLDGYTSTERDQIIIKDPIGDDLVREMFAGDLQYTARIQTAGVVKYYTQAGLAGTPTFKMAKSADATEKYTFKSQYLVDATLIGADAINLIGNDKDNVLEGNSANNIIRAGAGDDTYIVTNTTTAQFDDAGVCTVTSGDDNGETFTQIACAETGTDKLYGFEKVKLSDAIRSINTKGEIK